MQKFLFIALCVLFATVSAEDWKETSTKEMPKDLENYMLYCTTMKDVPAVTTGLPEGFTCPTTKDATHSKLDTVLGTVLAKEKSPKDAAKWFFTADKSLPHKSGRPEPFLNAKKLPGLKGLNPPANPELASSGAPAAAAAAFLETELVSNPARYWPSKTIPYCWGMGWHLITKMYTWYAMRQISSHTSVRFVKVACDAIGHKIEFKFAAGKANSCVGLSNRVGNSCSSIANPHPANQANPPVGTVSTKQAIEYDSSRGNSFCAAHEIIHSLGFSHVQQRIDSDTFITVGNRADVANCAKKVAPFSDNGPYHYESIMHYPRKYLTSFNKSEHS